MALIEKIGTVLVVSIIGIISILIILIHIERELKNSIKKVNRNKDYIIAIQKISKLSPEKILKPLDKIARSFFQEAFKIKKFMGYSELIEQFKKHNKPKIVEFCETINPLLYSRKKDSSQTRKLVPLLIDIVNKNKIATKQELMKHKKKKSFLRKVNVSRVSKKKPEDEQEGSEKK